MSATKTFNSMLPDDQMREYLATGNSLVFDGLAQQWQDVERQVERLGFGERYFVSQRKGIHGDLTKVTPATLPF